MIEPELGPDLTLLRDHMVQHPVVRQCLRDLVVTAMVHLTVCEPCRTTLARIEERAKAWEAER